MTETVADAPHTKEGKMARYLTGTLSKEIEQAIKQTAEKHAGAAIAEGAHAPWGDGETLPDVDDLMRVLDSALRVDRWTGETDNSEIRRTYACCYDRFFRDEIDRLGALADK